MMYRRLAIYASFVFCAVAGFGLVLNNIDFSQSALIGALACLVLNLYLAKRP